MTKEFTKIQVANALKRLVKTKKLAKITVHDIVKASGVNRSTFYYHFIDKDDLINWIFKKDVVDYFLKASTIFNRARWKPLK
jgi:AcrR family transcriptional regulator